MSEKSPEFLPEDVCRELKPEHREVMLDLVLAWGRLDCALGQLLGSMKGMTMPEAAEAIGKMNGSGKLDEISRILKANPNGEAAAKIVRKHKKTYEKHSKPRNRIAHAACVGYWTIDPEYVVFAIFEKEGDDGLAVEIIPLQEMQRATKWGKAFTRIVERMIDANLGDEKT